MAAEPSSASAPSTALTPCEHPPAESVHEGQLEPYDEHLLERARTQWQFGDWDSLCALSLDRLAHHPQRAILALLAAAGQAQCGAVDEARSSVHQARTWGAKRQQIARILVSGVYNSLVRAAILLGRNHANQRFFATSLQLGWSNTRMLYVARARADYQLQQLASTQCLISSDFPELSQKTEKKGVRPLFNTLYLLILS